MARDGSKLRQVGVCWSCICERGRWNTLVNRIVVITYWSKGQGTAPRPSLQRWPNYVRTTSNISREPTKLSMCVSVPASHTCHGLCDGTDHFCLHWPRESENISSKTLTLNPSLYHFGGWFDNVGLGHFWGLRFHAFHLLLKSESPSCFGPFLWWFPSPN